MPSGPLRGRVNSGASTAEAGAGCYRELPWIAPPTLAPAERGNGAADRGEPSLARSNSAPDRPARHVFVTGGVASSLGKGLTASSLGRLLKARGLRVTMQKLDPYLNVDPGTMNPFQHGEVVVTDDGTETDLDIGHYERFLDIRLSVAANVTTGQLYSSVIGK